jgi:hypothetical protein
MWICASLTITQLHSVHNTIDLNWEIPSEFEWQENQKFLIQFLADVSHFRMDGEGKDIATRIGRDEDQLDCDAMVLCNVNGE